jgi:hypothetical protein
MIRSVSSPWGPSCCDEQVEGVLLGLRDREQPALEKLVAAVGISPP